MSEAIKAQFSFLDFKVKSFKYSESNHPSSALKVMFNPSGLYNQEEGIFSLTLGFVGTEDMDNGEEVLNVLSEAYFKFEQSPKFEEIPEFFYRNSIAIFFPYLRSFISTMTLQAHAPLIILDLMNLTGLEPQFRANTKVRESD